MSLFAPVAIAAALVAQATPPDPGTAYAGWAVAVVAVVGALGKWCLDWTRAKREFGEKDSDRIQKIFEQQLAERDTRIKELQERADVSEREHAVTQRQFNLIWREHDWCMSSRDIYEEFFRHNRDKLKADGYAVPHLPLRKYDSTQPLDIPQESAGGAGR